jgi:superfamily I DNA/RNA helicase
MANGPESIERYKKAKLIRQEYLDQILRSQAKKKIVVAGPGTGKTYLFKKILEGKKKNLTLTFINSLVEDLSLDLYGISEVRTLHSFARGQIKNASVFPKLSGLIREDCRLLTGQDIDFDRIFYARDDHNSYIDFYRRRRKYYACFGYTDIIYAAALFLENNREKIPAYEQVLVDEFQDFNLLEVSLIDLLGDKSPILIVGDDDQALYDFKLASAKHIRDRHGDGYPDYASFTLPYCSRCTRVVVDAANDILSEAARRGLLKGRIFKEYLYFDDGDKDIECENNPKLLYRQLFAKQIPWYIADQISGIAKEQRSKFSVLVICPIKSQCRAIATALTAKGFRNISFVDNQGDDKVELIDALKLLLSDNKSSLGWRIAMKAILQLNEFETLLRNSNADPLPNFVDLVGEESKKKVKDLVSALRRIGDDEDINDALCDALFDAIEMDARKFTKNAIKEELESGLQRAGDPAIRNVPIKITTIQSSKGLAEDFVFIAHVDDRYLVKDANAITDREICSFLVALTRARKRVHLISSLKAEPTFLQWIVRDRIDWGV